MYDSVNPLLIPQNASIVAGYLNGPESAWPAAAWSLWQARGALLVQITTRFTPGAGDVLDVEKGDAGPNDAGPWVMARRSAGHSWPTVYCDRSNLGAVLASMVAAKVPPAWQLIWLAKPGAEVLAPGTVATQYGYPGPYDVSITAPWWPPPPPAPSPGGDELSYAISMVEKADGSLAVAVRGPLDADHVYLYEVTSTGASRRDLTDEATPPAAPPAP